MKNPIVNTSPEPDPERDAQLFFNGIESINQMCANIRAVLIDFPDYCDQLAAVIGKRFPMTAGSLRAFALRVGVKVVAQLEFNSSPGARRLKKLPIEVQREYLGKKLEVCTETGDTQLMDFDSLTESLAEQVIRDHILTVPEQRAWMTSEKIAAMPKKSTVVPGWRWRGGKAELVDNEGRIAWVGTDKDLVGVLARKP